MEGIGARRPRASGALGLALGLGLFCAGVTLHPVHESDPFWQMTLGRAVLEHGSRVVPEPTAFPDFTEPAVVPEWLWGVATYGLHEVGGWGALAAFLAAVAFLAGAGVARLASRQGDGAPLAAVALVATLAVTLVASRLRLRPQAAFLAILPSAILLAQAYARAPAGAWLRPAAALFALQLLWTQLHGSFVLGPALVGIAAGAARLRRPGGAEALRDAGVVAVLAATLVTSAHGLDTLHYVLSHQSGDASLHIEDIHPPNWESFNPVSSPFAAAYLGLWAVALAGMLLRRRWDVEGLGFALLGAALLATANRFFAAAGVLLVPLAARGAAELASAFPRPRFWLPAAAAGSLALLPWTTSILDGRYGPLLVLGLADGQPRGAATLLRELPEGSRVLSSFAAGGPLGFWLGGRVRTYVDARTPLYFDGSDFAVSRDLWTHPDALARGLARFGAVAVVVERDRPGCAPLLGAGSDWVPVVVEPRFTTFGPRGRFPALHSVAACGERYLAPDACADGGARLDAEIAGLAALGETSFLDHLRAERALRCDGDAATAARLLPARRAAHGWRRAHDSLEGRIAAARGDLDHALARLGPLARAGDLEALNALGDAAARSAPHRGAFRDVLEDAVAARSDHAPPELRANLALLCAAEGDAACVRFHGVRAAARGSTRAREALRWLAAHHPETRVRRDAVRWLESLEGLPPTSSAETASAAVPTPP